MYLSDQPIENKKDDLLHHSKYVEVITKYLLNYHEVDSLTIGLFGSWGSGKTSIINMVLNEVNEFNKKTENDPIVIKFEPWIYSDEKQLISQFFVTLSNALIDNNEKNKKIGDALIDFADSFNITDSIPIVGKTITGITKVAFKLLGKKMSNKDIDLAKQRNKIINLLNDQKRKIIIVIDDIDRISNEKISLVFKLIASIAKFPNIIYLVSFDRENVIKALEDIQHIDGNEYLKKIIQVPIIVPEINKNDLMQVMRRKMKETQELNLNQKFSQKHWNDIYNECIDIYIGNIRDIYRVINAVAVKSSTLSNNVELSDLFAITLIEFQLPVLYQWIMKNKFILTGGDPFLNGLNSPDKKKQNEKYHTEITQLLGANNNSLYTTDIIIDCLVKLFPKFGIQINEKSVNLSDIESRHNNFICNRDKFDRYFELNPEYINIKYDEINDMICRKNYSELVKMFIKKNKEGHIYELLEELESHLDDVPRKRAESIIIAILNTEINYKNYDDFFASNERLVNRILLRLTNKLDKEYSFLIGLFTNIPFVSLADYANYINLLLTSKNNNNTRTNFNIISKMNIEEVNNLKKQFWFNANILIVKNNIFELSKWRFTVSIMKKLEPQNSNIIKNYIENKLINIENMMNYLLAYITEDTSDYEIDLQFKEYTSINDIQSIMKNAYKDNLFSGLRNDLKIVYIVFCVYIENKEQLKVITKEETINMALKMNVPLLAQRISGKR